jgi:hypothetical protein
MKANVIAKLLTKSQGTLCPAGCLPTIVLLCPGAPKTWLLSSYYWTIGHYFQSRHQCFTFAESFCQNLAVEKLLRQQKTVTFFQSVSAFQSSVTCSRVADAAQQTVTIKAGV